jgi:hypothetical protein
MSSLTLLQKIVPETIRNDSFKSAVVFCTVIIIVLSLVTSITFTDENNNKKIDYKELKFKMKRPSRVVHWIDYSIAVILLAWAMCIPAVLLAESKPNQ